MNKFKKILLALVLFAVAGVVGAALAPTKAVYAAEETTTEAEAETADNTTGSKALAAAIAIGMFIITVVLSRVINWLTSDHSRVKHAVEEAK